MKTVATILVTILGLLIGVPALSTDSGGAVEAQPSRRNFAQGGEGPQRRGQAAQKFEELDARRQERAMRLYGHLKSLDPDQREEAKTRLREGRDLPALDGERRKHMRSLQAMRRMERARLVLIREISRRYIRENSAAEARFKRLPRDQKVEALRSVAQAAMARGLAGIYKPELVRQPASFAPANMPVTVQGIRAEMRRQVSEDIATLSVTLKDTVRAMDDENRDRLMRDIATLDLLFAQDMTRDERGDLHRRFIVATVEPDAAGADDWNNFLRRRFKSSR